MKDILNYDSVELEKLLVEEEGIESFRAKQLRSWLYRRRSVDFTEMTDVKETIRLQLAERYRIYRPEIVKQLESVDGSRKYLFRLDDGAEIEAVLIKQTKPNSVRFTVCVSSQVGCGMGCKFCRTALMGFKRNLQTYEIIGQVLALKDEAAKLDDVGDFSNIVFMGMGEPLHNFDNVMRAVTILNDPLGLAYSARKITVSTSGLVPEIELFGKHPGEASLAVSLNATTDEVRTRIMPINRKWNLESLFRALHQLPLKKNKHVTLEYVLLKGVNDSPQDLRRLPKLLHGLSVKLNLIPYNANSGLGFESTDGELIRDWQRQLNSKGINTRVRWSKGEDIQAACGQLAVQSPQS